MANASRCPECREPIHPFAATCPSCGADLDAHRRRRQAAAPRRLRLAVPRPDRESSDLVVVSLILLLMVLFAPLFGAVIALLVVLYAHHNGLVWRRNIAIACAALGIFNLMAPTVLLPHVVF